ncbi:hypothetical protein AA0473_0424 [Acetobacter orleanensis NRIC 0473]|nr:hypothetical protein AA0473_0424 [Acetobacter orleanensis NRIC 0473]
MIAKGYDIHPAFKQAGRNGGGKAESVAGIFRVDHNKIQHECFAQGWQAGQNGLTATSANNIAQKQNSHAVVFLWLQ